MTQCEGCISLNEEFEQMARNSALLLDKDPPDDARYCEMFPNGIPEKIKNDETACEYNLKRL